LLTLDQRAHAGSLDGADVDEYIPRPVVRFDESKAFLRVEEPHSASGHDRPPCVAHLLPPDMCLTDIRVWGDLRAHPLTGSVARQAGNLVVGVTSAALTSESSLVVRARFRNVLADSPDAGRATECPQHRISHLQLA